VPAVATRQKIAPFPWFDANAREAAEFFVSVFPGSEITAVGHFGAARPGEPGSVFVVEFRLDCQVFTAVNGGPHVAFDEAISFVVDCAGQAEIGRTLSPRSSAYAG
jgi:predicted 3-demethylubiquinone-9 3-methyltransferase (glyoxalase superfamily)